MHFYLIIVPVLLFGRLLVWKGVNLLCKQARSRRLEAPTNKEVLSATTRTCLERKTHLLTRRYREGCSDRLWKLCMESSIGEKILCRKYFIGMSFSRIISKTREESTPRRALPVWYLSQWKSHRSHLAGVLPFRTVSCQNQKNTVQTLPRECVLCCYPIAPVVVVGKAHWFCRETRRDPAVPANVLYLQADDARCCFLAEAPCSLVHFVWLCSSSGCLEN